MTVGESGALDQRFITEPPEGALILEVFTRLLEKGGNGRLCAAHCKTAHGIPVSVASDHLWLTKREWKSLVPDRANVGETVRIPPAVIDRLVRFHLVDNTRGEPTFWRSEEVRTKAFTLQVVDANPQVLKMRLSGEVLLRSASDDRGYDAHVLGIIEFERPRQSMTRFDIVALGEHWGETSLTLGARAGQSPLGVAFQLAKGDRSDQRIPPQGARSPRDYFGIKR